MPNNLPTRHHYIPEFYTKRWATSDRKLCQFTKPYLDEVKPRRVFPAMTGYADHLYELEGLPEELAQQVETAFMQPVDDMAAVLLQDVEAGRYTWTNFRRRSAWARFIMSLLMRTPEEVQSFKEHYVASFFEVTPENEANYRRFHVRGAPRSFRAFLAATDRDTVVRMAMTALVDLMDTPRVGEHIINMRWGIRTFPLGSVPLLASDRPVLMSNPLIGANGYLLLPIGPKLLFYAANDLATERRIAAEPWQRFVPAINRGVCEQAVKFVYGQFETVLPFVQEHMGKVRQPSLIARMKALSVGFSAGRYAGPGASLARSARGQR